MCKQVFLKRLFAVFSLFLPAFLCASAQETVKGSVRNADGEPLVGASVFLFADSLLTPPMRSYATTGRDGAFTLSAARDTTYWVQVKCIGYSDLVAIVVGRAESYDLTLKPSSHTLKEVIVKARYSGISVSGDTIKFDAEHFRNGFEGSVGELLGNMPGVEVSEGGSVSYGGKTVSSLLVNGKDLFSSENRGLVIKNMAADDVAEAQFIQDYQGGRIADKYSRDKRLALNLKTQKPKSVSMYADGNGGYKDKYEAKTFRLGAGGSSSLTSLLSGNNIGTPTLTASEYINMMLSADDLTADGNRSINITGTEAELLFRPDNIYKDDGQMAAIDGKHRFSDKFSLSGNAILNHLSTKGSTERSETYLSSGLRNSSEIENSGSGGMLLGNVRMDWKPSETFQVLGRFGVNTSDTESESSAKSSIPSGGHSQTDDKNEFGMTGSVLSNLLVGKDLGYWSIELRHRSGKSNSAITSKEALLPIGYEDTDGGLTVQMEQGRKSNSVFSELGYRHTLSRNYALSASVSYLRDEETSRLRYAGDSVESRETLARNETRINVRLKKTEGKFHFSAGSAFMLQHSSLTSVFSSTGAELLPSIELGYKFSQTKNFSLTLSRESERIGSEKASGFSVVKGYNEMTTGALISSPYQQNNKLQLSYYDLDTQRQLYFTSFVNVQTCRDAVVPVISQSGLANVVSYKSGGHYSNAYATVDVEKHFKGIPLDVKGSLSASCTKSPSVLNGTDESSRFTSFSAKIKAATHFRSMLNAELTVRNQHDWTAVKPNGTKTGINNFEAQCKLMMKERNWKAQATLGYNHVNSHGSSCSSLNVGLASEYRIGKFSIKLTARNILRMNSNEWVRTYTTSFFSATERYQRVQGSILVGVRWQY